MNKEHLPNGLTIWVDTHCTFGSDAVLLARFTEARPRERVCDLGTGCGIVPLLLQTDEGGPVVDAVDCEPHAVALARRSVNENGLGARITVHEQSWSMLTLPAGGYDRVTCNPPYFRKGGGKESPISARRLARHETGDTLREVAAAAARLLKNGGKFTLCHRPERLVDVMVTLRTFGLEPKRLQWVHDRPEKEPFLMLCEAIKGGKPSVAVLPPVFIKE